MRRKKYLDSTPVFQPRIRVICGRDIALGPGKVELLEHVADTGSIVEAASRMEMSYMRAWMLIRTMNRCFKEPLVVTARGGKAGGGAQLTEAGHRVIALYRQIEANCLEAANPGWQELEKFLHA
jgi:molybdate transport system regulatory protein